MSEAEMALSPGSASAIPDSPTRRRKSSFFTWAIQALPFLILGVGAIIGMAATTVTGQPKRFYWSVYTPLAAAISILEGCRLAKSAAEYSSVFITQLFQWLAVGAAMYLLMLSPVRGLMNDDAVGLTLLTFIAMSVFIAGIHMRAWRLLVMGAFLGATVYVISFVEAYAIVLMAIVLAVLCLLGLLFWAVRK